MLHMQSKVLIYQPNFPPNVYPSILKRKCILYSFFKYNSFTSKVEEQLLAAHIKMCNSPFRGMRQNIKILDQSNTDLY